MVKGTSKIKKVTTQLAEELEKRRISAKLMILFGSHATGNPKKHSDIDLAIVSPSFRGVSILKRQELLGEAIFPLKEPIEALGYTPDEYKQADKLSFLGEIKRTGKIIYQTS